jgi:ABC-2 type transport system permease protein
MNIGIGMILSAWYVFFRDIEYLYGVFLTLLTYLSAIFYTIDRFPVKIQRLFFLNPVYTFIRYFRLVVIEGIIPSAKYHLLCAFYALFFLAIGCLVYKKNRQKFLYYM